MITDKLENIDKYSQIPQHVKDFVKDIPQTCGKIEINNDDYANIEVYNTKPLENCLFETHKKFTDIQIILSGKERLDYTTTDNLKIKTPYDENKDISFFENNKKEMSSVYLDGTNFVMIFPNEAHRPQMNYANTSTEVKKLVIKIKAVG